MNANHPGKASIEMIEGEAYPAELRYPPRSPDELIEYMDFLEQLNRRMRELRDAGALPRTALTLPDEFDGVVADTFALVRRQAEEALASGETLVEVRLPLTDRLLALARWTEPRLGLITNLTRASLVQPDWERPLKLFTDIIESVLAQLPPRERDA